MDQYIGKMLDNRYEILECIGTGGMAMVFKARDQRLNRLVAVKILKPELASDAEFRRRFHDESQAVAMLSHINIVAIYDVSRSDDLDYIVMELVDGMTLKQYMKKRGAPLNWREALHFITQIIRALGHAHSRGIVHRDIKPQNIMVLRDGSIKVTDFGIARVASAAQATLTQEALGSVHYISPEQARGSHIDGRSDLYSAGVVLYEMLTGRLPFEGETPVSVAIQHINSIPIPPRDLNSSIPPALEAVTLKAMASKVENRYASADEMLSDLEEFRKNPDAIPEHAQQAEEQSLIEEPTRVVPVSEIKQEQKSRHSVQDSRRQETPAQQDHYRRRRAEREEAYDDYDDEPRRGVPPILFAVIAILIFVGGVIYFVIHLFGQGSSLEKPRELTVPNLTVYTWEQLQNDPTLYEGFTLAEPQYVQMDDREAGTIIGQDPAADTVIQEGVGETAITLTVTTKEETFPVPDLTGELSITALNDLKNLDLIPESTTEYNETVDADHVIRTIPAAGSSVKKGDTVRVYVSLGKEKEVIPVPPFVGMTLDEVKAEVKRLELKMGEVREVFSDEEAGKVTWQNIPAYTEVEKGASIDFWVSKGPEESPSVSPSEIPSEPASPSVSDQPSVPPVSEPPSPSPDHTAAVSVTKNVAIDLTPYASAEYVHIKVVMDRSTIYDATVKTSEGELSVPVSGMGRQTVEIYVDGNLTKSPEIDFSA